MTASATDFNVEMALSEQQQITGLMFRPTVLRRRRYAVRLGGRPGYA